MNRPFLTRDCADLGVPVPELRSPAYRRLFQGVAIRSTAPLDLPTWIQAARLVLPGDARLTGLTALRMAGVAEAYARLCATSGLRQAVEVGDRLAHLGLATPGELHEVAGCRASGLVREGNGSLMETRLRLLRVVARLPEPLLQAPIRLQRRIVRVDQLDPVEMVVSEYEGRQHLTDPGQWSRDLERYEELTAQGYLVLRFTAEHLRDPIQVVRRLHAALRSRGYRGRNPSFTAEWRQVAMAPAYGL